MTQSPDVSIIIVSWNTRELLRACLASIETAAGAVTREVIVVDNASRDGSTEMVESEFSNVRLVRNADNFGFAAANNQGMELARGRYVLLLNSDTLVLDGAIEKAITFADQTPGAGIVGCRTIFPDGRMQRNCFLFPSVLNLFLTVTKLSHRFKSHPFFGRYRFGWWDYLSAREVDGVAGCFMLVQRAAIEHVGPMAEHYFMYAEDADWCWRFRNAGYSVWYTPDPCIIHLHDASASQDATAMRVQYRRSILAFIEQRSGLFARWICNAMFLMATIVGLVAALCGVGRQARSAVEREATLRRGWECLRLHRRELVPWRPADGSDLDCIARCLELAKRCAVFAVSLLFQCGRSIRACLGGRRNDGGQVLYYHGVTSAQQHRFRRQLSWSQGRRRMVDLSTVLAGCEDAVAVTFDDGFENVRQCAVPVLRELRISATVFAVSGQLGRTPQWKLPAGHCDAKERMMTAEALAVLEADGVHVESHTCSHPRLPTLAPEAMFEELSDSRSAIQSICKRPVRYLSVPYGDWCPEVFEQAKEAGYERVLTSDPAPVSPNGREYVVGRVAVSPDDWMWEFKLKALGAYQWKAWMRPMASRRRVTGSDESLKNTKPARSNRGKTASQESHSLPVLSGKRG